MLLRKALLRQNFRNGRMCKERCRQALHGIGRVYFLGRDFLTGCLL